MADKAFKNGFTLIELSIVIAIAAILLSSAAVFFGNQTSADKNRKTREKMEVIAQAIETFTRYNAGLPCPASKSSTLTSDATLGVGGAICAYSTSYTGAYPDIVMGAVPYLALDLPPEYMFDEWGNRIDYIMDENLVVGSAGAWYPDNLPHTSHILITLPTGEPAMERTPRGQQTTGGGQEVGTTPTSCVDGTLIPTATYATKIPVCAAFLLISHGANGYMAYNSRGQQIAPPAAPSTNPNEIGNSFVGPTIGTGAYPATDNIFVTSQPSLDRSNPHNYFDDILVYRSKENIISP